VGEFGASGQFGAKIQTFTKGFFDRGAVDKAVGKAVRKQLSWFGGYCRRVVRNSIKEKGGTSAPGSPPFAHTAYRRRHAGRERKLLAKPQVRLQFKDSILYALNFQNLEVVIGPTLFNGRQTSPTVPELLEGGGEKIVTTKQKTRTLHYKARPYMHPGFDKSLQALGERLKGCVTN
jgi:hypothetical protein